MSEPTNTQKVREQIARQIFANEFKHIPWGHSGTIADESWRKVEARCLKAADAILSLPGIEVRAESQELPQSPSESHDAPVHRNSYRLALQDMLNAGWVKCELREQT